ncbi:MAG: hypothetical protein AB7H93_25680 [Vicinamibacterales bacterium]
MPSATPTTSRRRARPTIRAAITATAAAAALTVSATAAAASGAGPAGDAGAAAPAGAAVLERLCAARGGSFHVNTFGGTNLICSAPLALGSLTAERRGCARAAGAFEQTGVFDGRASWFCFDVEPH